MLIEHNKASLCLLRSQRLSRECSCRPVYYHRSLNVPFLSGSSGRRRAPLRDRVAQDSEDLNAQLTTVILTVTMWSSTFAAVVLNHVKVTLSYQSLLHFGVGLL